MMMMMMMNIGQNFIKTSKDIYLMVQADEKCAYGRDRLVVRTPRCGRGNLGSNPGHGRYVYFTN